MHPNGILAAAFPIYLFSAHMSELAGLGRLLTLPTFLPLVCSLSAVRRLHVHSLNTGPAF